MTDPTTIDRHALCKLLAKWAGVEIHEHIVPGEIDQGFVDLCYWIIQDEDGGIDDLWDPFTDANHMELVKAGLRKKGYGYEMLWVHSRRSHRVTVWKIEDHDAERRKNGYGEEMIWFPTIYWANWHESESLALALAIQAMEEGH